MEQYRRPRCYLDILIDDEPVGRVIVELYADICPITSENFRALCTGEKGVSSKSGKPLWYKGAAFHRVVKNFVIQSGDFEAGNGTGGESIFGVQFKDENFIIEHNKPFLLSMANKGRNTNGSQFFITTQATPHLNGKHTAFGHVITGCEIVRRIEDLKTDSNNKPLKPVIISDCGELIPRTAKKRSVSPSASSSSTTEEKKKKKKRKKHKKEKKPSKSYVAPNSGKNTATIDQDEIPPIPSNSFLMRRTSPSADYRRTSTRDNMSYRRRLPSHTRSGRKVKGRGNMRYRTPESSDERSGSETPPHWKQAQSRLKKLDDVMPGKKRNSASEMSCDEEEDNLRNPHLSSKLGLVTSRNTDEEREGRKDARMSIDENRRKRETSHNLHRDNSERKSEVFKQLLDEDQRHGRLWFDSENTEQRKEVHNSLLRSKIVVKPSIYNRNSREEERNNYRENTSRKYGESRRRQDSFPDKRTRSFRRYSTSPHENFPKQSDSLHHQPENSETVKDRRNEKQKESSSKTQRRFDLLANDLFKYRKEETIPETSVKTHTKELSSKIQTKELSSKTQRHLSMLENDLCRYIKQDKQDVQETLIREKEKPASETAIDKQIEKNVHSDNLSTLIDHHAAKSPERLESEDGIPDVSKAEKVLEEISSSNIDPDSVRELENDFTDSENKFPTQKSKNSADNQSKHSKKCSPYLENITSDVNEETKEPEPDKKDKITYAYNDPDIIPLPSEGEDTSENTNIIPEERREEVAVERNITTEKTSTKSETEEETPVNVPETTNNEFQDNKKKSKYSPDNQKPISQCTKSSSPEPQARTSYNRASKSPTPHQTSKKRIGRSPSKEKTSSSRRSSSPGSHRSKPSVSRRNKTSNKRSRSRSARRSTSRSRGYRRYNRSPDTRQRGYRHSNVRNRSPELKSSSFRRQSSPQRGRARRSDKQYSSRLAHERNSRRVSSSSSSSSSSSRSEKSVKKRKKRSSSSSSSSSSTSSW